jgi:glycosyltransferase involved in cell wall biosynthesis
MRVLFMSQLLPVPVDAGPKLRAYYVLRYLAEAGHEVTLLCFVRPGDREQDVHRLRRICSSIETVPMVRSRVKDFSCGLRSLCSATPFLILRDQMESMDRKLEQITKRRTFDALHADQLWMAPYGMNSVRPDLTVLDQHNAMFTIPRRMAEYQRNPLIKALLQREASKLQAFERVTCERFDHVVWVTKEDRAALDFPGTRHCYRDTVIPIATDPSTRCPVKRSQPFRVTFVGGMHWPPNTEGISWFAERVWPKAALRAPSSVLTVIGKKPPKKLLRTSSKLRIEATGYVSDLNPYLSETAVFVVPLHSGAGMRVKILDAWCWGIPVVSTSVGAEGIKATPGENLLIADDEESFADCVVKLLQNRSLAQRLSDNGRATVETDYNWRKLYQSWDQIYH